VDHRFTIGSLVLSSLIAGAACSDRGVPGGDKPDPEYAKQHLLQAPPTPKIAINADLGGKVVYLGCDLDKPTVKPGEKFTIVHYFKVVQAPSGDYRLFTHVKGAGQKDWINVDATTMRSAYPTSQWQPGDIIRDEQQIALKGDWASATAAIHVGMYRRGDQSEKARLPVVSGPSDGHGAIIVATLQVGGAGAKVEAPPPLPASGFVVKRAAGPVTIDGKADEPAWATANATGAFQKGQDLDLPPPTTARLLWDDKYLYAFVDVTDDDVFSEFDKPDDSLWKADVVELFIDADANGKGYVELQVNPNNAQFDAWFAGTRAGPKSDVAWTSGLVSAVVVDGTLADRSDKDKGWHAEIAVPWAAVKGGDAQMAVTLPPSVGQRFKLNLVRVEGGRAKSGYTASAWAPISRADFHNIDALNVITFGDESGQIAAAATPTPTAMPTPTPGAAPGSAAPGSAAPGSAAPGSAAPGSAAPAPGGPPDEAEANKLLDRATMPKKAAGTGQVPELRIEAGPKATPK
jgi:hypothetical protein